MAATIAHTLPKSKASVAISINGAEHEEVQSKINVTKQDELEDEDVFDPQITLKDQLDKNKGNDTLKRFKEFQLHGSVDMPSTKENKKEAEVKVIGLAIVSKGRADIMLPFTSSISANKNNVLKLKQGITHHLKMTFVVSNNAVSGLMYTNIVWKSGIRVNNRKITMGNYRPKQEPYVHDFEEESIPTGFFARGSYSARTRIVDDEGNCYLDFTYYFDIQKN